MKILFNECIQKHQKIVFAYVPAHCASFGIEKTKYPCRSLRMTQHDKSCANHDEIFFQMILGSNSVYISLKI